MRTNGAGSGRGAGGQHRRIGAGLVWCRRGGGSGLWSGCGYGAAGARAAGSAAGFDADAVRIARAFLGLLVEDFERRGTLVEKYDVVRRTSDLTGQLRFGYASNEVGFGWTNGVALELLRLLGQIHATPARTGVRAVPASP